MLDNERQTIHPITIWSQPGRILIYIVELVLVLNMYEIFTAQNQVQSINQGSKQASKQASKQGNHCL
jgi:hypothetical protein